MDRPQWRFIANYRLHQRLQVGVELNPKAKEVGPLATLFLSPAWYQFKVKAIPAMYLLDRESQIVAQWVGKIDYEEVEKEVLRRLGKRLQGEGP